MTKKPTEKEKKLVKSIIYDLFMITVGLIVIWIAIKVLNYTSSNLWFNVGVMITCMFTIMRGADYFIRGFIEASWKMLKLSGHKIVKIKNEK